MNQTCDSEPVAYFKSNIAVGLLACLEEAWQVPQQFFIHAANYAQLKIIQGRVYFLLNQELT